MNTHAANENHETSNGGNASRKHLLKTLLLAAVICALIVPGTAFALQSRGDTLQTRPCMQQDACPMAANRFCTTDEACPNYSDADANGVCDNAANGACPRGGYVDSNNDGACDNAASSACPQGEFVDENSDGICDNAANGACPRSGYVDSDSDGICDNAANGNGPGNGCGNGNGYRHGCGRAA